MDEPQREVEVDAEASRILEQRVKTADKGRLVSASEARRLILKCFSRSRK
jgi:hypothetical protein